MATRYRYRKSHGWVSILAALVSLIIYASQQGWFSQTNKTVQTANPGSYAVTRFVDGDTIVINMNGKSEKVRLIGVDTPETHKPNTPVQCYGPAAAAYTKNTVGSQKVRLEADSLSSNRDRYQRLLRYVYLPDGKLLNEQLVLNGYGFYYPYFPFTKSDLFSKDQKQAQQAHRGLWGNCSPTPTDKGGYISNPA
jgi:endonuclease YncB( thermonuclease family)